MVWSPIPGTTRTVLSTLIIFACAGGTANADFVFGERTHLGLAINSPAEDAQPSISADGLSLFFHSERSGGYGDRDIWVARRATKDEGWTTVENVGPPVNTSHRDSSPDISPDGLTLYFDSDRPGGSGESDIWVTTRTTRSDPWGTPVNLGPTVNASSYDAYPSVSADGLTLFMQSYRPGGYGGYDIWMTTRRTKEDPWRTPGNLGSTVNSSAIDGDPAISPDGLALFFTSLRPGGYGIADLYLVRRATVQDSWGPSMNLGPIVNSSPDQGNASISADGLTLYFASGRPGGQGDWDLWQARIIPIVDLNGDGKVDGFEVCTMANRWGTGDSLCDIGPMPWGDGVVDIEDLKVLAEYIGKDVDDPALLAHWALDETEGDMAYDSAGDNDADVVGGATWRPEGGAIDGALSFDGIDARVETPPVLNPGDGPFSVLAWVKGELVGQVLLSQSGGRDWLLTDGNGALMTDLRRSGRMATALYSNAIVTDNEWHRIGLRWEDPKRALYVDDITVAEDEPGSPPDVSGGLYIGAGANLEPGTFFTGLIDDVRICSRAVSP